MSEGGDAAGRHKAAYSFSHKLFRVFWGACWLVLFRPTPPPLWAWRRAILRAFGARIGRGARIYGSARIWHPANLVMADGALIGRGVNVYNQGPIEIGRDAVISWGATLCASTHDVEDPAFPLVIRSIRISDEAWVAAEAFVGPGVTVGEGAVLGARGVAMKDLEPWGYFGGNPASYLKPRPRLG
jgi:putative colanic acid biosynthesis acetyltransferase WcaF